VRRPFLSTPHSLYPLLCVICPPLDIKHDLQIKSNIRRQDTPFIIIGNCLVEQKSHS
jgi:hypothetical protein